MITNKLLQGLSSILLICSCIPKTQAACQQNPQFMNLMSYMPSRTYNIPYDDLSTRDLETITIPYGNGAYLDTPTITARDCGATYLYGRFLSPWVPSSNRIAPSNLSGISVSVRTAAPVTGGGWFNETYPPPADGLSGFRISHTNWDIVIKKTGQVTQSGSLTAGNIAYLYQTNTRPSNSTWYLTTLNIPSNSIKINVLSCSLKSPSYNIDMGDWYITQFNGVGSTSASVSIPIVLTCKPGTNIKATVTSNAGYQDALTGKLKLEGSGQANGIAIQLLDKNNSPIRLNFLNSLQNNVPAGDYIFNWKARYVQTATTITPGTANSSAMINIQYE
ncbi:TPA: fimbrial protein [Providencia alcalifaciens]